MDLVVDMKDEKFGGVIIEGYTDGQFDLKPENAHGVYGVIAKDGKYYVLVNRCTVGEKELLEKTGCPF